MTLERAHVDDLVLGESAVSRICELHDGKAPNLKMLFSYILPISPKFERRSPRFMPPGHGPGPVVQPSLKNAIVASAKAFVNLLSRVKKVSLGVWIFFIP